MWQVGNLAAGVGVLLYPGGGAPCWPLRVVLLGPVTLGSLQMPSKRRAWLTQGICREAVEAVISRH